MCDLGTLQVIILLVVYFLTRLEFVQYGFEKIIILWYIQWFCKHYNSKTDLLDPRSQRAGSYKFGAVIVNGSQWVSEWVSQLVS